MTVWQALSAAGGLTSLVLGGLVWYTRYRLSSVETLYQISLSQVGTVTLQATRAKAQLAAVVAARDAALNAQKKTDENEASKVSTGPDAARFLRDALRPGQSPAGDLPDHGVAGVPEAPDSRGLPGK